MSDPKETLKPCDDLAVIANDLDCLSKMEMACGATGAAREATRIAHRVRSLFHHLNTPAETPNGRLVKLITDEIEAVEKQIANGKGTWPQPDYVRDETWAMWRGESSALRSVLRKVAALSAVESAEPSDKVGGDFYNGVEWFGAWLVDHCEGETITEELIRGWAIESWNEHLKRAKAGRKQ